MRICLMQPSHLDDKGKPIKYEILLFPNLTLPTLAGLTPKGVDVSITIEYLEEIDYDETLDLVGVTAQTCQAPRAYQIADEFRKRGCMTMMGGLHASACPDVDWFLYDAAHFIFEPRLMSAQELEEMV